MIELPAILTRFAINTRDVVPELASQHIGLEPSRVLKKGEPRTPPRPPVAESSWMIESPRRHLYSLDESMTQVLNIVWPKRREITSFCNKHNLQCLFVTVVWADAEHRPIYELSRQSFKKISALHASWIMDLV